MGIPARAQGVLLTSASLVGDLLIGQAPPGRSGRRCVSLAAGNRAAARGLLTGGWCGSSDPVVMVIGARPHIGTAAHAAEPPDSSKRQCVSAALSAGSTAPV
ncbi:hypothetical protein GCM10022223_33050 [Kineosporia mesophila]|uniref:Uncharacterized protein n=1 Tax=Kineosporia mesophila TaxID=566012 RepID=A0ABP6ZM50_9ACTN